MSRLKLKQDSFIIRIKEDLVAVRGYSFNYEGLKLGVCRIPNTYSIYRRKYNWAVADLATGMILAFRAHKKYITDELEKEKPEYMRCYLDLVENDFYKKKVEEFNKIKRGGLQREKR